MGLREKLNVGELRIKGTSTKVGTPVVTVLARGPTGDVLLSSGATVPTNADKGYAAGALFIRSTGAVYFNAGTATSAQFSLSGVTGAGTVTSAEMATSAVFTTRLADAAVTSAKTGAGAITSAKIGTSAVLTTRIGDAAVTAGKIGANAVLSGKIKYAAVTAAVASNTASLSVATSANAVIIGYLPTRIAGGVGLDVNRVYKVAATTAKVSLSAATTHTAGVSVSIITLKAA